MSEYVTKPVVMIVGVVLVLAVIAVFAYTYSQTGIGGSTISSYATSTQTTTNNILPYLATMVAAGAAFTAAIGRRR